LSGHRSHQMELPFHNLDLAPGIRAAPRLRPEQLDLVARES
jgi:hypothetical protein